MGDSQKFQHFEVELKPDGSPFELGRGAMGITYKAYDTNLRCPVALKVITHTYLNSAIAQQRFFREARAAAALKHPNVASVFHLGQEGENFFYAMEFVEGETVDGLLRRTGPIPVAKSLQIALQVNRALGAAEKQGLVHRDLKPANIMIQADSENELVVKLIDFGLAKSAIKDASDATITMQGFLGTPHFASPEQLEEKEVDIRSDIYSLGVTLWCMLLGKTPYSGSLAQVMSQHLYKPVPLDQLVGFSPSVVALLRHMLEKEPGKRPQNPLELRREIELCLADPQLRGLESGEAGSGPATVGTLFAEPEEAAYASADLETLPNEVLPIPVDLSDNVLAPNIVASHENVPASHENISATNQNVSALSENVSALSQKLSATSSNVSALTSNISATTSNIPASLPNLPGPEENPPALPLFTPPLPVVAPKTSHSGKIVALIVVALLFFGGLGGGAWFVLQKFLKPRVPVATDRPVSPTPQPTDTTPEPTPIVRATPPPTPIPTPEATPDPEAVFQKALAQAESLETTGTNSQTAAAGMQGYLELLKKYPDRSEIRQRLEGICARLIRDESPLAPEVFESLRSALEGAAEQGVVRAQLLLAQNIRTTEPDRALELFEAVARTGNVSAMRQGGLLYSVRNRSGDMARAVALFEQGADLGDTTCKLAAGETYLLGKGVPRDADKGVQYLQEAAANDEPRAWDRLGDYYSKQKDFAKAVDAFTRAKALGWVPALANLGALYINGNGVAANPQQADALFAEGAAKGDARAMVFHAQCLEAGLGTTKNLEEARSWYRKAAAAGEKRATAWLEKNGG